ncbi:MFS transporter [Penicillium malachiteum]|uniref:MFS transporter n=1 Tax=Penicillium malachiteum TaxID=1324776 RepID=UPI0025492AA1|nr:MFS transporter [Penicillium malachiteum]KAJ5737862.1 MFS transporter [Penicillium malachiteum]
MSEIATDKFDDWKKEDSFEHHELAIVEQPVSSANQESTCSSALDLRDPRNWPHCKKDVVILMISFHSMSSTFMTAGIVPASSKFAVSYGVSLASASYLVSIQILLLGVTPIFWVVAMERYGRHYILIFSVLASMVCNLGGAWCTTYAGQMVTRALCATFISPPIGIGSVIVTELTTPDERARKLGWWVVMTILGTPAGPFIMGFVVQHTQVRWIFWIYSIVNFLQAVAYLLLGAETLYPPVPKSETLEVKGSVMKTLARKLVPRRLDVRPMRLRNVLTPFELAANTRILVAAMATSIKFCYGNIVYVVEMPLTFTEKLGLDAQQTGHQFASYIQSAGGNFYPADRFWLTYIGFFTIIAGLLIWGSRLEQATTWNITPCVGIAIASFGNQIQSNVLTAYAVDTSPDKSAHIGVFFNFIRLLYGFIAPFYFPYLFNTLNYAVAAGLMCGLVVIGGIIPVSIIQLTASRKDLSIEM